MHREESSYRVYRALLYLYPKSHRMEYGTQMLQTLDDIMSEQNSRYGRVTIWLRVCRELPLNLIEEHINNLGNIHMSRLLKNSGKRSIVVGVIAATILLGVSLLVILNRNGQYSPSTYAQIQRTGRQTCLEKSANSSVTVNTQDNTFIGNVVATSITDAHAGTNVDVYFKTYDGSSATGTAAYSGGYGSYNFTVKKVTTNDSNSYVGGWQVIHFTACTS